MELRKLGELFLCFARVGVMTFGGGYAMLPILQRELVERRGWATAEELGDYYAVGQCTPGIIAVNSAVYIGMKVAGVPGALAAVAGAFTPPFTVILIIASLFPRLDPHNRYLLGAFAGIRACVTGMILVTGTRMFRRTVKTRLECAVVLIFFVLAILKVSPALLILAAIPFGWCYVWWQTRRLEQAEKSAGPDAESSSDESESASKDAGEGRS